jgi:pyruvate kinase
VPEEDIEHLKAGIEIGVDMVALSFVRTAEDVLFVREHTARRSSPRSRSRRASTTPRRSSAWRTA